jgi:hypothetical protein
MGRGTGMDDDATGGIPRRQVAFADREPLKISTPDGEEAEIVGYIVRKSDDSLDVFQRAGQEMHIDELRRAIA